MEITGLTGEGDGVGRHDGLAVFVPLTVPGDHLRVRLTELRDRYARGEIQSLASPGPGRVEARCPIYGACGGCQWQHLDYAGQLRQKVRVVTDALERIGHLQGVPVLPVLGMEDPWGYRAKGAVPFAPGAAGFYARGSHRVVPWPDSGCAIHHRLVNGLVEVVLDEVARRGIEPYDEATGRGLLRHLVARVGVGTGEVLAVLVVNGQGLPDEAGLARALMARAAGLVGVVKNVQTARTNVILGPTTRLLAGRDHLLERLDGLTFKVSARSFFQVNPLQAERLYRVALDWAGPVAGTLVDAYCGTGTLACLAARKARQVVGIEEIPEAVEDARENARINGIENARFLTGRVEDVLPRLAGRPEAILLDPPRKGCAPEVLEACLRHMPPWLVYVSCNPATLARDLATLTTGGPDGRRYRVEAVQPVDLFPHTAHVECVARLVADG